MNHFFSNPAHVIGAALVATFLLLLYEDKIPTWLERKFKIPFMVGILLPFVIIGVCLLVFV